MVERIAQVVAIAAGSRAYSFMLDEWWEVLSVRLNESDLRSNSSSMSFSPLASASFVAGCLERPGGPSNLVADTCSSWIGSMRGRLAKVIDVSSRGGGIALRRQV